MEGIVDETTKVPSCPQCGTEVQSTWRWCLACGYDPDGLREQHQRRVDPTPEAEPEAAGSAWSWLVIVVVALLLGGGVYLLRVRASGDDPAATSPAAVTVPTTEATWARFTAPDGSFTMEIPGTPIAETLDTKVGTATTAMKSYSALVGSNIYVVSTIDVPPGALPADPATRLSAYAAQNAELLGGTPVNATPVDANGHPGLDYDVDLKGVGVTRTRAIVAGDRIYTIAVLGATPSADDFARVTGSFRVS